MHKSSTSLWAAVPVKAFGEAKTRLSAALCAADREGLARAMLEDVLCALSKSRHLSRIVVVTADAAVADLARIHDAEVLHDLRSAGQSAAVEQAAAAFTAEGGFAMLTVPGDLPLLTAQDIDSASVLLSDNVSLVLMPAGNDGGTNGLLCQLPNQLTFHFGDDSFNKHCQAAKLLGLPFAISRAAGFQLDLDRPADLEAFLIEHSQTQSAIFLSSKKITRTMGEPLGSMDR